MHEFYKNQQRCYEFFKKNLETWVQDEDKHGKFVLIENEKVVDFFDTFEEAYKTGCTQFAMNDCVVQEVVLDDEKVNVLPPFVF